MENSILQYEALSPYSSFLVTAIVDLPTLNITEFCV